MISVYFIRHGETDWNVQGRMQGHSDIPLNAVGQTQAQALISQVQDIQGSNSLVSSDLQRARQTAEYLVTPLKANPQSDPGFREVHLGEAEGLTREVIISQWGETFWLDWSSDDPQHFHQSFAKGENRQTALQRFEQSLQYHLKNISTDNLWIVSHGLILRTFFQSHFPKEAQGMRMKNCAIQKLAWDQGFWKRAADWNLF